MCVVCVHLCVCVCQVYVYVGGRKGGEREVGRDLTHVHSYNLHSMMLVNLLHK